MIYNWQHEDWPKFYHDTAEADELWQQFNLNAGQSSGLITGLSVADQQKVLLDNLVAEAMTTSAIEGEFFSREDVYSSIKKNLGLIPDKIVKDQKTKGIAALVVKVHETYAKPLSKTMLFSWHKMLMQGYSNINKGKWRTGEEPMQVVSSAIGKEIVYFEAPPSHAVPDEMNRFIDWFNHTALNKDGAIINPMIRSAIAHLYFETIHPFEDGNGRIGRAIAEKVLSQGIGSPTMFSISKEIDKDKKGYYTALKQGQGTLDLTDWLSYFIRLIINAQQDALNETLFTLKTSRFFDTYKDQLNQRQQKVIKRMVNAGHDGFEGGMTAKKFMSMTKASKATATRDLQSLYETGILIKEGGGRNIHYQLKL
ncbi:MAG: Fic family protein [Parvicella sp.]|jgi:Fic family protein